MKSSLLPSEKVDVVLPLQEATQARKVEHGKTKIILICLCSLFMDETIVHKVGEALIKLANKLCLVQQKGQREGDHILLGVYRIIEGSLTPLVLLNPKDYSLKKFHEACKALQVCPGHEDNYCFDKNEMDESSPRTFIEEQLRFLTTGSVIKEWMKAKLSMTKILFMLSSRAMKVHLRQDSLKSFLSQASEGLVEVDVIEFKDPFQKSPADAENHGFEELIAQCETATYYDIDVTCGEDLELFLSYQCLQPILGSSATEITLQFRTNQMQIVSDKVKHCMLSPLVLTMEMSPEVGEFVCPCHGRISASGPRNVEHYEKCAVTKQFVPFEKSNTLFKLGNSYWEMLSSPISPVKDLPSEFREIKLDVLARIKLTTLQEALLFGMPYLLNPNLMFDGGDDVQADGHLFWNALISSLKEREECLVASCHYNFDTEAVSITPLKYVLMPNVSCGNMLLKRVASYEELLIVEANSEFGQDCPPSTHTDLVDKMLDDLSLCSDVTELSVDIDQVLSDLFGVADSKCSSFIASNSEEVPLASPSNMVKYSTKRSTGSRKSKFQAPKR
jgi:hypothetical protein